MRKYLISAIITILFASAAFALDLDSARKSGLVGEKIDGYVAAVSSSSAEISALVNDVNTKRKAVYEETSKHNGQPIDIVQKLAAEKIIKNLDSGVFYMDASGKWKKK